MRSWAVVISQILPFDAVERQARADGAQGLDCAFNHLPLCLSLGNETCDRDAAAGDEHLFPLRRLVQQGSEVNPRAGCVNHDVGMSRSSVGSWNQTRY